MDKLAPESEGLGARSVTAVFWGGGGAVLRILLQLATQISLARILGPTQYGLFAIGAIVISFSNFFSDIGIAYGLIQKSEITAQDLRFVFTWQVIIGSAVTTAIVYFSSEIAIFFGDAQAQKIVSSLAIVCLLNALAAPSNNILKRNLNFKSIQTAQLAGYIGGYIVVGLPLAIIGTQVMSLVVAWIVQASLTLLILYAAARHPLRPLLWYGDARTLSKYGGIVLVTNVTNWFIGNIDRAIIARFFSSKQVGFYATSYNILQSPTSAMLGVIQPVFFSASARLSENKEKIVRSYYALIGAIALVFLPFFACISVVSETFIVAVYGNQWLEAATVFRPLALSMPLFMIWGLTTPILWTGGSPISEFKAQLPIAILWACTSWIAAHYTVEAVGWSVLGMFAIRCVVVIMTASRTLALTGTNLWFAFRGGLFVSGVCAAATLLTEQALLGILAAHPITRIIVDSLVAMVIYFVLLFNVRNLIPSELASAMRIIAARSPALLAKHLYSLSAPGGHRGNH